MDTIFNPDELQKRSDYSLLIQARLNGWSGSIADKAENLGLSIESIIDLVNGRIEGFSLSQLIAIAKKAGISVKI